MFYNQDLLTLITAETNMIIIFSSVAGAIVIGVILFFVLDRLFLTKKRCIKQLKELEAKYEYLHALLTGQDSQYIQRLEIISRTNLLYVDMHSSYFKRSKEIRDTSDVTFQDILSDLGAYLEENKFKEFKQYLKEHQGIIKQYENSVNQLTNDLIQVIKPEEECRDAALNLKEKLREVKSKYNMHEDNLSFVALSFERVFDKIDHSFAEFENKVETANYDDANRILPSIEKVIDLLNKMIDEIPELVDQYTNRIPTRVKELQNKYQTLISEGKPLNHLYVEEKINSIEGAIQSATDSIKRLSISSLGSEAKKINQSIDEIFVSFDTEVAASEEFTKKKDSVLNDFKNYENEYIKITNNIEKFRKFYIIDEEHNVLLADMKKKLDVVGKDKRRLDVYMHSLDTTPFSVLVEKLNILENGTNEFGEQVEKFRRYLASLKNDSESAFANLKAKYEQLKYNEFVVRNWKISSYIEDFDTKFTKCYNLIDECNRLLNLIPINVNAVNICTKELDEATYALQQEIQEIENYKNRGTEQILLANRDRMKFAEVNNLVNQCETLYFNGDFKSAFESSDSVLKKLSSRDGK